MSSNYYNNGYNNNGYNNNGYDNQTRNNEYYNQHPQQYENTYQSYTEAVHPPTDAVADENNRGVLGAIGGGIGGGIIGKQTKHGFLGTVGGALVGSLTEDFIKKRNSRPSSPQPPSASASASATATAVANGSGGHTPLATPMSPPIYHTGASPIYTTPGGIAGQATSSTTTVATSYFQQPPCVGTAHPCTGQVHYCVPSHGHGHGHGHGPSHGHGSWGSWGHK